MGSVTPLTPVALPATGFLEPTWHGFIFSTSDALLIFEACLRGDLHPVPRRPHDRERLDLIRSGSVFVYMETDSGIKRWTDGIPWSPSRILGNFLIYRELEKAFGPGEKKRALKHGNKRANRPGEPYSRREDSDEGAISSPRSPQVPETPVNEIPLDRNNLRALIGSLTDSYTFREPGLVKKTITIRYEGINYHLVSYYTIADVQSYQIKTPTECGRPFAPPRRELWEGQNFRSSDVDKYEPIAVPYQNFASPYTPSSYGYRSPSFPQQAMSVPNLPAHSQSYAPQLYRTTSHEQGHTNESPLSMLPSTSNRSNAFGRSVESPTHAIATYHDPEGLQREAPSQYHHAAEDDPHSSRTQYTHYSQGRLPPMPARATHGLPHVDTRPGQSSEYGRGDFTPASWQAVSQAEPGMYQEDRSWTASTNAYSPDLYRDPNNNVPQWSSHPR